LSIFLPRFGSHEYGIKFIEIVGELWFGPKFEERPIGDRVHTLPLMQDLLHRIMERQVDFMQTQQLEKENCLCPELQCLLRYLYSFLRESFEQFPLDCIAYLRLVIEAWLYVLAPWTIPYKHCNADRRIQAMQAQHRRQYDARRQTKSNQTLVAKIFSRIFSSAQHHSRSDEQMDEQMDDVLDKNIFLQTNDDRLRSMEENTTQFATADEIVEYELDGIESVDMRIWRPYIVAMLPFYSSLSNFFIDSLLKYDFAHPLKQLCVLKVFHLYKNAALVRVIEETEALMFNPLPIMHGDNGPSADGQSAEALRVVNSIQDITYRRITDYRCLPFARYCKTTHGLLNYQNIVASQQATQQKAKHLYVKCRKVMTRLYPTHNCHNDNDKENEENDEKNEENEETKTMFIVSSIQMIISSLLSVIVRSEKNEKNIKNMGKTQRVNTSFFMNPADNVQIIRYIVGDLESLFGIGTQQQMDLMNVSIMYEPSQSAQSPLFDKQSKSPFDHSDERRKPLLPAVNVWDKPKGEWESHYALRAWQAFYFSLIHKSPMDGFYCQYMAKYHRLYLVDLRVIGWISALLLAKMYCHFVIFYLFVILFLCAILLPFKAK